MADHTVHRVSKGYRVLIWYTIVGANGFGLATFFPEVLEALGWRREAAQVREHDEWYRILGSLWIALGVCATASLNDPIKYSPVYAVQLVYKSVWLVTTVIPRWLMGTLTEENCVCGIIMASFVILDLVFVPWAYLLANGSSNGHGKAD